ncbi:MAG: MiaB/RimO family radical SAM methylthiotransferase [Clostridia bacterium]|nr:MiaB/RimO family radical SAM methylthiotransferase [Clostridia bacterium]
MKVKCVTLGCKTNKYESNAMEQSFKKHGYEIVSEKDEVPDIYIVNTCSVTNVAERKSRQMLRKVKEVNPQAIVIACGCYVQVAKEEIEKIDEVDIVLGINEKNNIVNIVEEYIQNKNKVVKVEDVMHESSFHDFGTTTYTEQTRAVVKIQDGCDRFCTYCIIPYARGKVRSREPQSIIEEIKKISEKGLKEVIITGIHIASYGKDFNNEKTLEYRKLYNYKNEFEKFNPKDDLHSGGFRLIELLEQINKIEGIERIRLGSIEPKLINKEWVMRVSKLKKICHHFHLSLQSGCDETLMRMNRRYSTEEFAESVKILRKYYDDVILTTDVIVGFPGETNEEFNTTYEFLKRIKFYKMHVFKYSLRRGTKAKKMPNQVDGKIKEIRSKKLIELSNINQKNYDQLMIGKTVKVLFEEREGEYYKGHTENYIMIRAKTDRNLENKILDVKIKEMSNNELIVIL